ncbi:MAG: AAA family ATPase [Candidatus Pacearchaeota archaeon]
MIIKKLILKNVRSYESLEINFTKGSTLLTGEIGVGKTSILLGIQFALFGLQPGQKGSSLLRQGEDNAYAKIIFEINEQIIEIERTIKKTKSGSITQEKNILSIDGDSKELSTIEIKNRIMQLLNYPKEFAKKSNLLYKYTVYTPQEEMKAIIQENSEIRLDTIRHIFGIDRYKRIKENTNIFLQKIKETIKLKEILIGELNLLKEKFREKNEYRIKLVREVNNLQIQNNSLRELRDKINERLLRLQEEIDKNNLEFTSLEKNKATLQQKKIMQERIQKEILNMQKQILTGIDFSYDRLKQIKEIIEKHKIILEEKNQNLMKTNSIILLNDSKKESSINLKEKVNSLDNCPTCYQSVSLDHKTKISKKTQYDIEEIERELETLIIKKNQLKKEIETEKQLIQDYEKDKNSLEKNRLKFEHSKELEIKIKSDLFFLERNVNEIKNLEEDIKKQEEKLEDFGLLKENFSKVKQEFEISNSNLNSNLIKFAESNKELEILKISLEELNDEILKKEELREQVSFLLNLRDWLNDKFLSIISLTEKNVLVKIRNEFSNLFSNWFNLLVNQPLSVRLDDNFTPIITNQDYELDYEFLSGGERTAVALAYRLALNQVLNSILSRINTKDLVILDEPTDGFAQEQIDKMRDIFEQLNAKQVIIVSHEQKIEGFVDHVIKVSKDESSNIEKIERN